jgi:hypothetical protein
VHKNQIINIEASKLSSKITEMKNKSNDNIAEVPANL